MMIWQEVVKTNSHTHFSLLSGQRSFSGRMPFKQSDSNHTEKPIFFSFFLLRKSSTWFKSHIDRASFFLALLEAWKKSYLFFSRLFNIIPTWRPKSVQTRFRQFMDAHKKYTSTTFFCFYLLIHRDMRVSWKCRFVQQLIFRRYFWVGNRKKRKEPNSRKNKTLVVDTAQRHYREDTLFLVSIWRKRMHNHHHLTLTLRNDPNFVRNGGRFTVRLCVCFCVMTQNRKKLKKNSSCKRTRRPYGRAATDDKSRFDTESRYEGCDVAITKFLVVRKRRLAVEEFQRPEATTFQRPSQLNGLVRTQLFCFFFFFPPPPSFRSASIATNSFTADLFLPSWWIQLIGFFHFFFLS